ncbi:MAG: hypothetical protein DA328_06110 [Nitrososphaeraceae archaeon]|nr:hypothetical protein [Nitrososphaeraceae archaeon]
MRFFLQLSKIPHYTTLQKFAGRTSTNVLERIISSFILFVNTRHIFAGIDSTGFKIMHASQYYAARSKLRSIYAKLSFGADTLMQIICFINAQLGPTRHDSINFKPIVTKMSEIKKLSEIVADKDTVVRTIIYWYGRNWAGTVSYPQEMNRYLYGRLLVDTERR